MLVLAILKLEDAKREEVAGTFISGEEIISQPFFSKEIGIQLLESYLEGNFISEKSFEYLRSQIENSELAEEITKEDIKASKQHSESFTPISQVDPKEYFEPLCNDVYSNIIPGKTTKKKTWN